MVDQTETTIQVQLPGSGTGWEIATAGVTTGDTVTFDNFNEILNALVVKLDDNSSATFTLGTNVVTVTQAGLAADQVMIFIQAT